MTNQAYYEYDAERDLYLVFGPSGEYVTECNDKRAAEEIVAEINAEL